MTTTEDVPAQVRIGTAGWSIGADTSTFFPGEGSNLERYAQVFRAAEVNSSFYRPHRPATWERWRESVPESFRFSVKMPKTISHERKLIDCGELVAEFLAQVEALGDKLGVLLLQLPPKLAFDREVAESFLDDLRSRCAANIAVEPRHPSWFMEVPDELLEKLKVARVAADPAICPAAAAPGGWSGLRYWRLHGSPIKYRSSYADRLETYADLLRKEAVEQWCIFDNTASSAAISDAFRLHESLKHPARTGRCSDASVTRLRHRS